MPNVRRKLRRAWHELFGHGRRYETFTWTGTAAGWYPPNTLVDGWRQWRCGCGAVSHTVSGTWKVAYAKKDIHSGRKLNIPVALPDTPESETL